MDNISPLAKTLAESNGIDWRSIQGTGDGGQIVEQDIINYLTRVMSGEEEPPATPVDLPPPDWTGNELPAGMSAEMLSQAGVDSDIAAMVSQPPVARPPAGQGAQLEEDEFELDMEDDVTEVVDVAPATTELGSTPAPSTPAPSSQPSAGLGGLLSQLYQGPASTSAQSAPVASSYFGRSEPSTPATQPSYGQADTQTTGFGQTSYERPDAAPVSSEQASYAQAEATKPEVGTSPSFTDERTEEVTQPAAQVEDAQTEAVQAESVQTEPATAVNTEDHTAEVSEPAEVPAETPVAEVPAAGPQTEAVLAPESTETVPAAAATRPEKAAWFGVYLRRDADLSSASDLREQLNIALGQDVPLSLLVARAAQQHVNLLGLSTVAIQDAYAHRARAVGERSASLRDALAAIDTDADGQPDVLVVNAGTFDLDEVHYPDTVSLSVGRVVDGRAALSLNGDVETTKAADFLAAVAASLEAPVALII